MLATLPPCFASLAWVCTPFIVSAGPCCYGFWVPVCSFLALARFHHVTYEDRGSVGMWHCLSHECLIHDITRHWISTPFALACPFCSWWSPGSSIFINIYSSVSQHFRPLDSCLHLMHCPPFWKIYFNLKGRASQRKERMREEREIFHLLVSLQLTTMTRAEPIQNQGPGIHFTSLAWVQGSKDLSHLPLLFQGIRRVLEVKQPEPELAPT